MAPVEIAPGLWRLELPLPIPRLPTVNAYLFPADDGVAIIDAGGGHEEGYQALVAGLGRMGRSLGDVTRVICTHLHPDHMGLATRLVEETGCEYVMHKSADERMDGYNDWGPLRRRIADLAAEHGAPKERVVQLAVDEPRPDWAPTSMVPTRLVDDEEEIAVGGARSVRAVHTPGHDDSHICLVDSETGFLFSGDHVLPGITPFVPYPETYPDNLGTYLDSLCKVETLDPPLTLPAHHATVERGAARAHQIRLHHQRRLDGMLDTLAAGPATAWAVMEAAFKPDLPPLHMRLAFQETLSHLEYLRARGLAARYESDGVVTYRRSR